jgi:hypothetical protein
MLYEHQREYGSVSVLVPDAINLARATRSISTRKVSFLAIPAQRLVPPNAGG